MTPLTDDAVRQVMDCHTYPVPTKPAEVEAWLGSLERRLRGMRVPLAAIAATPLVVELRGLVARHATAPP